MQKKLKLLFAFWIGFLTSDCVANLTRNDLITSPICTVHGKLMILIQDREGFSKGIRDSSSYNIAVRFDEIPESSEGETVSVQVTLFTDESEEIIYEGPQFSGVIERRTKYNDWLVGRDTKVKLNFANYDLLVTVCHPHDHDKYPEILVYTEKVLAKRLEKTGWLDRY